MAFIPKVWHNDPNTTTPLDAAGLIDLETRLAAWAVTAVAARPDQIVVTAPDDANPDPADYADGTIWLRRLA